MSQKQLLKEYKCNTGESISELSTGQNILLVFIRHSGCTFCRETLDNLGQKLQQLLAQKIEPVIVHMGDSHENISHILGTYGLSTIRTIADPTQALYKAFSFNRGSVRQLFGLSVIKRALSTLFKKQYRVGKLAGDAFQLGGAVVIRNSEVIFHYPTKDAADIINFDSINSSCSIPS